MPTIPYFYSTFAMNQTPHQKNPFTYRNIPLSFHASFIFLCFQKVEFWILLIKHLLFPICGNNTNNTNWINPSILASNCHYTLEDYLQ